MRKIILTFLVLFFSLPVMAFEPPNLPAEVALSKLREGNYRFSAYKMKHPNINKSRREHLINGQHPFAAIITCSDSRVPPEIIFDQGLGDLFVIRNAGNIIDEHVMGSVEYAVHHLGVNLVIVLGHEYCGAVGAAMKDEQELPAIQSIIDVIRPAVDKCKKDKNYSYESVIKANAKLGVEQILKNKELYDYSIKHDLKILPAYYCVDTGEIKFITTNE